LRSIIKRAAWVGATLALVAGVLPASADHATRPHTKNIQAKGHSPHPATANDPGHIIHINSDIAFWGNLAFNGNYDGFRIIDISDKDNPAEISHARCNGNQGDIVVWENILVRAWNSPAPADNPATPEDEGRYCDGQPVPVGFEGMHVFDISNLENPELVGEVELSARPEADAPGCGTHTLTAIPDPADGRLLVYNATSGGNSLLPPGLQECDWLDIIEVPLDDPGSAGHLHREPLMGGHAAHDSGVILGDVNMAAIASGHMSNVFDIGDNQSPGGSPEDPVPLFTIEEPGVCNTGGPLCNGNWHSAAFTWDGDVIILGWEPGGGTQAECEASDPDVKKSAFFYDAETGAKLGQWVLPRPQGRDENCTIHNYNTVPLRSGRDILVSGNYQAGTWVTDLTDPANPVTVAWSDPPSLGPGPSCTNTTPPGCQLGGAWSSYWYNNFIYESEITKGLNVFRVSDRRLGGAIRQRHSNPQTQEFSLDE
jgi:hypothetical protein